MTEKTPFIVTGGPIYTGHADEPWIDAFGVRDGVIVATGELADVRARTGVEAREIDLGGRLAMPGLIDGHIHLHLGGTQLAWELPLLPTDDADAILEKVRAWTDRLGDGEWVIGGIVGSPVLPTLNSVDFLARLDDASGGHAVLLRDDTMHNRVVNSAALAAMGVGDDTPDPEGGTYVRDAEGRLTGTLWELAGAVAEGAAADSHADPAARTLTSMRTSIDRMRALGYTSLQDAATMANHFGALRSLEDAGELHAWIVASMPNRDFIEAGVVGEELFAIGAEHASEHVLPTFVKFVLDGVPVTRTTALLDPYPCRHEGDDPEFRGEALYTLDDLVAGLRRCYELGLGAKMHATGDGSVRLALDAAEIVRRELGDGPILQIAHMSFIAESDIARFAELGVYADACPFMWFPSPLTDAVLEFVQPETAARMWPFKELLDTGALISGGSDWPVGLPVLNPWLGIEAMVTRRDTVESGDDRTVNAAAAISLEQAVAAFTSDSARALGIDDRTGTLREGRSADFIVTDQNVFDVPIADVHRTVVDETWFQGARVHERSS